MILVPNFIKIKSRKKLRREIADSSLTHFKAGSNDQNPGAVGSNGPIRNPTGVPMPGAHQVSEIHWGESFSISQGGMGGGSVGSPPEVARPPLTAADAPYPYSSTTSKVVQYKLQDLAEISYSRIEAGAVENNPATSDNAGSIVNALERTVGPDKDRTERAKQSKLEWIRKAIRGK
jgi:hypothetical protein